MNDDDDDDQKRTNRFNRISELDVARFESRCITCTMQNNAKHDEIEREGVIGEKRRALIKLSTLIF